VKIFLFENKKMAMEKSITIFIEEYVREIDF
jgi:hypothetical protein